MNSNAYKAAGFAAIALAILFPVYWIYAFGALSSQPFIISIIEDFYHFTGWDVLFIIIGALEIGIYLVLSKLCRNQFDGELPGMLLWLMALVVGVFHLTVLVDITIALGLVSNPDHIVEFAVIISIASLFLYAFVAFVFFISMLVRFKTLTTPLKVFSIGLFFLSAFHFSIFLSFLNIFLFPVLMVVLAVQFLRGEQTVEVV
jgi:hypothetical protein